MSQIPRVGVATTSSMCTRRPMRPRSMERNTLIGKNAPIVSRRKLIAVQTDGVDAPLVGHALPFFIEGEVPTMAGADPVAALGKPTLYQVRALMRTVAVNSVTSAAGFDRDSFLA